MAHEMSRLITRPLKYDESSKSLFSAMLILPYSGHDERRRENKLIYSKLSPGRHLHDAATAQRADVSVTNAETPQIFLPMRHYSADGAAFFNSPAWRLPLSMRFTLYDARFRREPEYDIRIDFPLIIML